MPRVIVTRPAGQAAAWVDRLRAGGLDAVALPLIAVAPAADGAAVEAAWRGLARRRLAVFVSPSAVQQFFAARPAGAAWPASLEAAAPGAGTAEALREAGVASAAIVEPAADAPQFDSEALWQQLKERDWRGAGVLLVRGDSGREWLVERLGDAGAHVESLCAYRRTLPVLDAAGRSLLESAVAEPGTVWLFSSSEAIANLEQLAGRCAGHGSAARAVATHPRIAERAREAGFGTVIEAGPGLAAVIACIQSIGP